MVAFLIIDMSGRACALIGGCSQTIDKAHIATAEYVTITLCETSFSTDLTAMDMNLCLSKHITVGIETMNTTIT